MDAIQWAWLTLLLPFVLRDVVTVGFILIIGVIQGVTTGQYPSLDRWAQALGRLWGRPTADPSSTRDDESTPPT